MTEKKLSSGVQDLINRLRDDGIAQGKETADQLVAEAHKTSKTIVDKAHRDAEEIVGKAQREAEKFRKSAADAVQLAARDTMLDLKSVLVKQFSERVSEFVAEALVDENFLQKVILEIAGKVRERSTEKDLEIVLPQDIIGLDELRRNPEKVKEGSLGQFVLFVAKDVLSQGVSITSSKETAPGLVIRLIQDDVQIDLTDEVVADLLLEHLLPRFRALLEGSIQ